MRQRTLTTCVEASAPCRVDLGGTLDLASLYLPLQHVDPATFNIALDMRTKVKISPWEKGGVKIASRGFTPCEAPSKALPFSHPMGLMFGVVSFFGADGVLVEIDSASPPRSALGGSSVAAVALVAAFLNAFEGVNNGLELQTRSACIAQAVESAVAGVVCGIQDQMAAAHAGISLWRWRAEMEPLRVEVLSEPNATDLSDHLAVAYCGIPHDSLDINGRWVRGFLSGEQREPWYDIAEITHEFAAAFKCKAWDKAALLMNRETDIRCNLTPDVLDPVGQQLVAAAREEGCGARFTGAGGGGCLWALGEDEPMVRTRHQWQEILAKTDEGRLLSSQIAWKGVVLHL